MFFFKYLKKSSQSQAIYYSLTVTIICVIKLISVIKLIKFGNDNEADLNKVKSLCFSKFIIIFKDFDHHRFNCNHHGYLYVLIPFVHGSLYWEFLPFLHYSCILVFYPLLDFRNEVPAHALESSLFLSLWSCYFLINCINSIYIYF